MVMKGTRDVERGSGTVKFLVFVALFIGYMVYTGTYNPITAAQNLVDTVLGVLPGDADNAVQQLIRLMMDLFYSLVDVLRQLLR